MSNPPDASSCAPDRSTPDRRLVTARQAAYLADVSGVAATKIVGRPIADLEQLLRWKIDSRSLAFRKVCGRVVKTNPVTGQVEGVPHATVHVEDTDCSFLWFFPIEGPWTDWSWLWLTSCHREEIAATKTDLCGNFCVWIPRWDIDRVLRLRRRRVCLPSLYKPSLRDVITRLVPEVVDGPRIVDPNPPDPVAFELPKPDVLRQIGETLGRPGIERLAHVAKRRAPGDDLSQLHAVLDAPAFVDPPGAPLTDDALTRLERVPLSSEAQLDLSPTRAIGPFLRCHDTWGVEWETLVDVPDITFSVTQDIDLDGDEESIYSESLFDVRWNAGAIPDVTLNAEPWALSTPLCGDVPVIICDNHPRIATAGGAPLEGTHHDNANGQAIKVNRPHPLGMIAETPSPTGSGVAPYAGTLYLRGCYAVAGAQSYRVLVTGPSGVEQPITGVQWFAYTNSGVPIAIHMYPDSQGWYPVPPVAQLSDPNMFMPWPTDASGLYSVRLELASGPTHTPLPGPAHYSDPVVFLIDNGGATPTIDKISWRHVGGPWIRSFIPPYECIVIERAPHTDIEIEVKWGASAPHLLDGFFEAGGCAVDHDPVPLDPQVNREHWYTTVSDNTVAKTTLYSVPGTYVQGSYSLASYAHTRAFQPANDHNGPGGTPLDWDFSITENPNGTQVNIAIIDA